MFQRIVVFLAVIVCISGGGKKKYNGFTEKEHKVFTDCIQDYLESTLEQFTCGEQSEQYGACVMEGLSLTEVPAKDQASVDQAKARICSSKKKFQWRGMKLKDLYKLGGATNPIELMVKHKKLLTAM